MYKKVQRSIYLPEEMWEKLDRLCSIDTRSPSQQIEHMLKIVFDKREKDNRQAIEMSKNYSPQKN